MWTQQIHSHVVDNLALLFVVSGIPTPIGKDPASRMPSSAYPLRALEAECGSRRTLQAERGAHTGGWVDGRNQQQGTDPSTSSKLYNSASFCQIYTLPDPNNYLLARRGAPQILWSTRNRGAGHEDGPELASGPAPQCAQWPVVLSARCRKVFPLAWARKKKIPIHVYLVNWLHRSWDLAPVKITYAHPEQDIRGTCSPAVQHVWSCR